MKKLLTGNEAVARGAYEAGVNLATAYPGTPSTEILENISKYKSIYAEWAVNEKVALEMAAGASIAGGRALASMKHVGLNVAADPLFTMAYEGVNGGLVIISADEPGVHSSQNEQDNRLYAAHAKIAMVEPSDSQEAKDFIKEAFEISEEFDSPVLFRMTTRVCHSKSAVEEGEVIEPVIKDYEKNPRKYIMVPANAKVRHKIIEEERLPKLRDYSNSTYLNRIEDNKSRVGIVTSGASYLHCQEALGDSVCYLKIGFSYPLPDQLIRDFSELVDTIYVVEENEPYMENHIKSMGLHCIGKESFPVRGEMSTAIIRRVILAEEEAESIKTDLEIPVRPPALCAGCPHRGLFVELNKNKNKINVSSDIGCYTLGAAAPLNVGDTVICMGAGFSAGIGFDKINKMAARDKKVFGIVGDSTFFHSGMTGLVNAVYNKTDMAMIILDNRITAMTGHQENPGTGKGLSGMEAPEVSIYDIVRAVGVKEENIREIDPYIMEENTEAVRAALDAREPFVIIARQACALIKEVVKERKDFYCRVDQDKCKKCKTCIRIGCPAISMKENTVSIDRTMCNGCSVCLQVCPFDAIERGDLND